MDTKTSQWKLDEQEDIYQVSMYFHQLPINYFGNYYLELSSYFKKENRNFTEEKARVPP